MAGLRVGLLGAGLFGMLMGDGFLGGLAGFASIFGLLLQVGLIVGRRHPDVSAGGSAARSRSRLIAGMPRQMADAAAAAAFRARRLRRIWRRQRRRAAPAEPLEIKPEDFDTFERLLGEIQTAYGREDLAALRSRLTPEMLSYYAEELSENASRGVVNELSDVKLLQGDLAEAWREGDKEYASVAMRYSLIDRYVDRATGKAAEGNDAPQEATEVWTFTRAPGGNWLLSAIQQT